VVCGVLLTSTLGRNANGSPNLRLDDPIYEQLAMLRARGLLPLYIGGQRPLSVHRAHRLLARVGLAGEELVGWWATPLQRAALSLAYVHERPRGYSTGLRPRDLAGSISVTCEHVEGRPCGDGAHAVTDLDSALGYGEWVTGAVALRLETGADNDIALDRAYVSSELGPVALEVGRDVLALGPSSRTQLGWGDHAPPLDHVRLSTREPFALTRALRLNALYAVGRLRSPQRYDGTVVTIARLQLDIADSVEVGTTQLLQLLGDGAASLGVIDFVLEHVRRSNLSASVDDSSNRRFGGDISLQLPALDGARIYYAVMFEDIRRARLLDAIRYDADHLVGIDIAATGPGRRHGVNIEWFQTGFRSHEHTPRITGFTNRAFVVGAPLGPDSESLYARAHLDLDAVHLYPWTELARLSSDVYELVAYGPINRIARGEDETRYRVGAHIRVPLRANLRIEGDVLFEHVDDFGFVSGAARNNAGVSASIVWYPDSPLGRLSLN
jgi:hypothetical protein